MEEIEVNGKKYFINNEEYKVLVKFNRRKQAEFQHNMMKFFKALRQYGKKEDQ